MKQKLIVTLLFTLSVLGLAYGQSPYITIPDANFRTYLQANFSSCFDGSNMMDTNCAKAISPLSEIDVRNRNISDLTGITYFQNVQKLYCGNNQLSGLPRLPSSLKELYCDTNQITALPDLPSNLEVLYCSNNLLTSLPSFSTNLKVVVCNDNSLSSFPPLNNVSAIGCDNNPISDIPSSSSISYLSCNNTQISSINDYLNLTYLSCRSNQLTSLPALYPYVNYLDCGDNLITSLPSLPFQVGVLKCDNNQLTSLPALPYDLDSLSCKDNQLNCLPALPDHLRSLKAAGNNIQCIPNLPTPFFPMTFTSDVGTTLCSSSNPNGCSVTGITKGTMKKGSLSVYPNPSSGQVTIRFNSRGNVQLKIRSADGREIYHAEHVNAADNIAIDLSGERKGMYYIQILSEDTVWVEKLLIE